jgi:hypothetical protein
MRQYGLFKTLDREQIYSSVDAAIAAFANERDETSD